MNSDWLFYVLAILIVIYFGVRAWLQILHIKLSEKLARIIAEKEQS